jgi:hypothetical protein
MINEHDLADWIHMEPTPLYKVKPKTYIFLDGVRYFFDHLDGRYSHCLTMSNEVIHIATATVVTPLEKA